MQIDIHVAHKREKIDILSSPSYLHGQKWQMIHQKK